MTREPGPEYDVPVRRMPIEVLWRGPGDPLPPGQWIRCITPTHMTEPPWRTYLTDQLAAKIKDAYDTTVEAMAVRIEPDADDHHHPGRYKMITAVAIEIPRITLDTP